MPADTEHQLFASSRLTKTEKEMVNAAKEFGDQTNLWGGFKFKINWDESKKIPWTRDRPSSTTKLRTSTETNDDKNVRGEVSVKEIYGVRPLARGVSLWMLIYTGEQQTPETEKQLLILPGAYLRNGEFARTKEGKMTVIPK
ncbi:hypothetical protein EV360DRAFT_90063 [Lentinula raphanica]|nr:hypothetical protein EV360DRAFT_90063 [Lentinula raphanica]